MTPDLTAYKRISGCLLAGAVGDALGYRVEFISWPEIRSRFGDSGVRDPRNTQGVAVVSDDTQMAMFTAEAMLRSSSRAFNRGMCHAPTVVWYAYLRWFNTQRTGRRVEEVSEPGWLVTNSSLHRTEAPGNTCLQALGGGTMGTVTAPVNNSKGCGTVMRVAPIGLVRTDAFGLGIEVSALTHGHPTGYVSGGVLAVIIDQLMSGATFDQAIDVAFVHLDNIEDRLRDLVLSDPGEHNEEEQSVLLSDGRAALHLGASETATAMRSALALQGPPTPQSIESLGGGWVAEEALAIALHCVRNAASPLEALIAAANHSGDSDSTAAVAGNILGVMHGPDFLPPEWVEAVDVIDPLRTLIRDLCTVFHTGAGIEPLVDRYPPN